MSFTPAGSKLEGLAGRLQAPQGPGGRPVEAGPSGDRKPPSTERQISFLIPPDLRDLLRQRVAASDGTVADVILDAIERVHHRLPELLAGVAPRSVVGPLFVRWRRPRQAPVKVQVNVRLTHDALSTIDELVARLGADSRTALITVALRDHLATQRGVSDGLRENVATDTLRRSQEPPANRRYP